MRNPIRAVVRALFGLPVPSEVPARPIVVEVNQNPASPVRRFAVRVPKGVPAPKDWPEIPKLGSEHPEAKLPFKPSFPGQVWKFVVVSVDIDIDPTDFTGDRVYSVRLAYAWRWQDPKTGEAYK